MPLDQEESDLLASTEPDRREQGVRAVLERAGQSLDDAPAVLENATQILEAATDWPRVLTLTDAALPLDRSDASFADLLARKAWCLFWMGRNDDAWNVLPNAREAAEKCGNVKALVRVFLVSGYVMDVRGEHERSFAWYKEALERADETTKPHVLLEMATSLSKQGRLADAVAHFKEALSLLVPDDAKHERLRFHILSRWSVALENLGDLREALRLQDEAIAIARAAGDVGSEFTAWSRRARTDIAAKEFDDARTDLAAAKLLVPKAHRGALYFAHDSARLHRAAGEWDAALDRYRDAVRLLPSAAEIITGFADLWGEILDGLMETFARKRLGGVDDVRLAKADLMAARTAAGIYDAESTTLDERRARAAASAELVRRRLLGHERNSFVAASYVFDLKAGTATPVAGGAAILLQAQANVLLACLFAAPRHMASMKDILAYSGKSVAPIPSATAARKVVQHLREDLEIGAEDVVRGRRGAPGGGFALVIDKR
jgi:tetratricopeptide (TPR) repeat protein